MVDLTVGDNDAGLKGSTLIGCDDAEQDPSVSQNASDCVKLEHIYQLDWIHEVADAKLRFGDDFWNQRDTWRIDR